jgi:hypothetical protein
VDPKKKRMKMLLGEEESLGPVRPEQEPPVQQLAVPCLGNKKPKNRNEENFLACLLNAVERRQLTLLSSQAVKQQIAAACQLA